MSDHAPVRYNRGMIRQARTPELGSYTAWLQAEGYQPSTIDVTIRHIKIVYFEPANLPPNREPHVRRYLRFVRKTRRNPLGKHFVSQMRSRGLEPAADIRKHGKRTKDTLPSYQWGALRAKLRRGRDDTSKLLIAYMQSPYRVSEFLDLRVDQIDEKSVRDKRSRDWIRNRAFMRATKMHQLLCPTKRCAYSRMRRCLQNACGKLKLTADLDTLYKSFHELEAA